MCIWLRLQTMITIQLRETDWEVARKHWKELTVDAAKHETNLSKIAFVNDKIFDATVFKHDETHENTLNTIPSVSTMAQILIEIDNETDGRLKFSGQVDDTFANDTSKMLNEKENQVLKDFISKPVKIEL